MRGISEVQSLVTYRQTDNCRLEQGGGFEGGRIPNHVLDGYAQAGNQFTSGLGGTLKKFGETSQLDKAEHLAEDAYKKSSDPNANFVDKLQAQDEMNQASSIRKQVEKGLDPLQRQGLEHINNEEKDAVKRAGNAGPGLFGLIDRSVAASEMNQGKQESKSLNNWIWNS